MRFEWDDDKAKANASKHHVTFEQAATAFGDPLALTIDDPDNPASEERFLHLGMASSGILVVVAFTERSGSVRIISARRPTRAETRAYEQED